MSTKSILHNSIQFTNSLKNYNFIPLGQPFNHSILYYLINPTQLKSLFTYHTYIYSTINEQYYKCIISHFIPYMIGPYKFYTYHFYLSFFHDFTSTTTYKDLKNLISKKSTFFPISSQEP